MSQKRILQEPAIILHQRPYSETSLLLDVFTQNYGRVSLLAKGAKRMNHEFRALQLFQPLLISFSGKSDLKTLTKVDWFDGLLQIPSEHMFSCYYLNELMIHFCQKDDVHKDVFNAYIRAITAISHNIQVVCQLRLFEHSLLKSLGLGFFEQDLKHLIHQADNVHYYLVYQPEQGFKLPEMHDYAHWPKAPIVSLQALLTQQLSIEDAYCLKDVFKFIFDNLLLQISCSYHKTFKTRHTLQDLLRYG